MKKIVIVGAGSYIGTSFQDHIRNSGEKRNYEIHALGAKGLQPRRELFEGFDVVFHVAGIVHRRETKKNAGLYYKVNRDFAVAVAKAAKEAGVGQFIILSSMSVYGWCRGCIGKHTIPHPDSHYGRSKLQADREIWKMNAPDFRVAILRPPMVYGRNCRGNYQALRKLAVMTPFFPGTDNARSMIYIGNLCEFVKEVADKGKHGLFFPQDREYVDTGIMVKTIAECHGKKVRLVRGFGWLESLPFKFCRKVFGSLAYEKTDTVDRYGFREAVRLTEGRP